MTVMGNNKNSSTHVSRGKFIKRKPPKAPIVCDDPANPTEDESNRGQSN